MKKQIALRITEELHAKLQLAASKERDPYAPSITQIIERGIDLALAELEKKRGKK